MAFGGRPGGTVRHAEASPGKIDRLLSVATPQRGRWPQPQATGNRPDPQHRAERRPVGAGKPIQAATRPSWHAARKSRRRRTDCRGPGAGRAYRGELAEWRKGRKRRGKPFFFKELP